MRRLLLVCALFAAEAFAALPPGNWEPSVRARLDEVIARNRGNPNAYAVFDFDYTTAIGDLSLSCVWHMLETQDFRGGDFRKHVMMGLPVQFRPQADALAALADAIASHPGVPPTRAPEWPEFACGYWKLFWTIRDDVSDPAVCKWRIGLFAGYAPEELRQFTVRAVERAVGFGGVVCDANVSNTRRGMAFPQEIKDLFRELREAGIAVYIVSGSEQEMLRAVTGDAFGLNVPPGNVFGRTYRRDAQGRFIPEESEGGVMDGQKPAIIRTKIAPRHHGADPVLVAGDSMGDYAMLTEFSGLEAALVFARDKRPPKLKALIDSAPASGGKVLVQGRDEPHGIFRAASESLYPPPGRP